MPSRTAEREVPRADPAELGKPFGRPRPSRWRIGGELASIGAIGVHYLRISGRERIFVLTAMLIPVNYLFLFLITIINGNAAPAALVVADSGPYARQFQKALSQSDSFRFRQL